MCVCACRIADVLYTSAHVSITPARRCYRHLRASVIYTCAQVYMTPVRRCYGLKFVYFSEICLLVAELKEEYMEIQEADEIKVKQEEMRNQEMTMNTGEEEWVPYNQEEEVAGLARVEKPLDLLASVLQEIGGVAEFGAVVEHEGSRGYFDLTDSQL